MMHTRPNALRASLPMVSRKPSLYLNTLLQKCNSLLKNTSVNEKFGNILNIFVT